MEYFSTLDALIQIKNIGEILNNFCFFEKNQQITFYLDNVKLIFRQVPNNKANRK